jgi:hypothetical protein
MHIINSCSETIRFMPPFNESEGLAEREQFPHASDGVMLHHQYYNGELFQVVNHIGCYYLLSFVWYLNDSL